MCEALKKLKEQSSGSRREEELLEEVTDLRTQLELVRKEQAALLKAELAAARATWNRDKQQEVGAVQLRCEQSFQEQSRKLEQALQQAREEAARQEKELLLQMEAKLLQRTEEQRQRLRGELLAELRTALADVQVQFLANERADEQGGGAAASEGSVTHIIQTSCRDTISRAVSQAKDEWRKVSWYQTIFNFIIYFFFKCAKSFFLQRSVEMILGPFCAKKPKVAMQNMCKQRSFCQSLASLVFRSPGSNKARGPTVHSVHSAGFQHEIQHERAKAEFQTITHIGSLVY